MAKATVRIPHNYVPRPYQVPLIRAMDDGVTRAVIVWHRRSGKDKTCLNIVAMKAMDRVGAYFYFYPTYAQAKKAIWDGRDGSGFKFMDHFPPAIVEGKNESDLRLRLTNGSSIQLIGTDSIDAIMSTNPVGCVFAEYSLQDPKAWDYVRPILRENGGWAIWNFTPRGKNHAHAIYEMAKRLQEEGDPAWFHQRLTVDDTGVLTATDIDAERREGMDEELIAQEYFCSFSGSMQGAYYTQQMQAAEEEGRICAVPYQEELPVDGWWDLGVADACAIWLTQTVGREIHLIDYIEESGEGLPFYKRALDRKPYIYGRHHAPHDIKVRELGTGRSRLETAEAMGIPFDIVPNIGLMDGIDATRMFLGRCWFDRVKTERGRLALLSYQKTWNEKLRTFSSLPYHNWATHSADAMRYLAVGHKFGEARRVRRAVRRPTFYDDGESASQTWLGS